MESGNESKREPQNATPEQLARQLEIELAQKRAAWARSGESRRTWRGLGILFLVVIVALTFVAMYIAGSMRKPPRPDHTHAAVPAATP